MKDIPALTPDQIKEFESMIRKGEGDDDCWLWLGELNEDGVGLFTVNGKKYLAQEVAVFIKYGKQMSN